jgi:DNA-binding transcriptional MerR regulator
MVVHYTVKEVAALSGATIKALHHYHKIGLLQPCETSEAGYRLYGTRELERLQQIMTYRELDFSLEQIGRLLNEVPDRLAILEQQAQELAVRRQRLESIIGTLRKTITCERRGISMDDKELFEGFRNEEEWKAALQEQNEHLKKTYEYDMLESAPIDAGEMNDMAREAAAFIRGMADALKEGVKCNDEAIAARIGRHLEFLNQHGHAMTADTFAKQSRYFLTDDFHLKMLEDQQVGLAYYLAAAAESFASCSEA